MSRPDVTMREVLLADMYEKEIDDLNDRLEQAIDMRNKYSSQNAILREALEKIIKLYGDVWPMDFVVGIAKQALQRARL